MRSSRSTNGHASCWLRARPTLLLPAPIKPTRHTALATGTLSLAGEYSPGGEPGLALIAPICRVDDRSFRLVCLAFLEVNFTTEGKQPDRRCSLADRTREGTPCPYREGCVFGLE